MKNVFLMATCAFLAALLLIDCKNKKKNDLEEDVIVTVDSVWINEYKGVVMCADCPGINTTLKLTWAKSGNDENTYTLTEEYIDRDTIHLTGKFNTERGFGDDDDATVVILDYDKPLNEQKYYVWFSKNPKMVYVLSPQKEMISDSVNYTLILVE